MLQQTLNTPRETTHQRIADALEDIVDRMVDTSSASNVNYDNTQSGLSANKVQGAVDELASEKVDKVAGKGLSTNDYTDTEKQKLANIESNAQANVQSDWNEDDTEDDGYIKNKPNLSTSLTAAGNPITIEASESNLVECVAKVECVQEGSGDPSPDNIRPITGQTEVVITDNGINQWDEQWEVGDIDNNGQNTSSSTDMRSKNYVKVFPNTAYYYKQNSSHTTRWFKVFYYDKNKTFISKSEQQGSTERTTPSNCYYVRFAIYGTFEDNNISINYPSTDTDYHAYKGKTYRVEIGQKNKLPPFTSTTVQGVTITVNTQGAVTLNGTATGNGNINIGVSLKAGTYKISGAYGNSDFYKSGTMGNNNRMYIYDGSSNYFDNVSGGREFTLSQDTTCTVYLVFVSGYTFNNSVIYPMIRTAIDDSEFAPYNPNLPDAIYGAELDVITGELTVTHSEVDLGTLSWIYQSQYSRFYTPYSPAKAINNQQVANAICSQYIVTDADSAYSSHKDKVIAISASKNIIIVDTNYSDSTAFKNAMNGVQLVYELATPYTIQLTPQQIRLLKGTNHLSCNTGDLTIKYYPDNVLGQLKGDIEKGLNAYYDYQIQALWDKIGELQA